MIQAVAGGIEAVLLALFGLLWALAQAGYQTATAVVLVADAAVAVVLQLLQLVVGVVLVTPLQVQGVEVVWSRLQVAVFQPAQGIVSALLQDQLRVTGVAAVEFAAGFLVQGAVGVFVQRFPRPYVAYRILFHRFIFSTFL